MLQKLRWLVVFAIILSSCSVLPIQNLVANEPPAAEETNPTCPPVCPTCPECPDVFITIEPPVCPTCPAVPTEENPTEPTVPPTELPPTEVPPTATETTAPTEVVEPTETPEPTEAPTFTPTATVVTVTKPYQVQENSPVYLQNFAHPEKGCSWLGVAGQVFDPSGNPVPNIVVVAEGFLGNKTIDSLALTGLNTPYGPGGFELELSNEVVQSTNSIFVTLYNLGGESLSLPVMIETFQDCSKNLIIVNFKQTSP